jgi:hypothetical protein
LTGDTFELPNLGHGSGELFGLGELLRRGVFEAEGPDSEKRGTRDASDE